jgi:hypothetical protein
MRIALDRGNKQLSESSQPGAKTGTKASSTSAPERAIAALKVSSWRLVASGPFDLTGPRATTRTVTSGIGFSPGTKNKVPAPEGARRLLPSRKLP